MSQLIQVFHIAVETTIQQPNLPLSHSPISRGAGPIQRGKRTPAKKPWSREQTRHKLMRSQDLLKHTWACLSFPLGLLYAIYKNYLASSSRRCDLPCYANSSQDWHEYGRSVVGTVSLSNSRLANATVPSAWSLGHTSAYKSCTGDP